MAMVGRKVFEFCPVYDAGLSSDCNVYDLDTHTWSAITSWPGTTAQGMFACDGGDDYVYVGGGASSGGAGTVYTQWYRWGPVSGTPAWSSALASLPAGRAFLAGSVVREGDYIYVFGGWAGSSTGTNTVYRYSISGDSWSTMTATLSANRYGSATAIVTEGEIMVIGGASGAPSVATVEVYDISGDSFTAGTSLPRELLEPQAFVVGNDLFVYGGYDSTTPGDLYTDQLYKWGGPDGWLMMVMRATSTGSWQGYSAPQSLQHPSGTQTAVLCPGRFAGGSSSRSAETVELYPAAGKVGVVGFGD